MQTQEEIIKLESNNSRQTKFSDYLYILLKWKKFIIINLFLIAAITTVIAFMIHPTYKATAVVMIPPENSMGLGGLTGLLSGKSSTASLGSKLLGTGGGTSEDVLMGILYSRTTLTNVINKFNLLKYYEIDDNNMDKALKAFSGDVSFEMNEYSMIEASVVNKDPKLSADIANYFIQILDSLNIRFNIEQAKNNRTFVEKRYLKNVDDLKIAEDSLFKFQKKYGIFAVPQQMEIAVKAAAEIEAQLAEKELSSYFIKQQYGENSPQFRGINTEVTLLRSKVHELKTGNTLSEESNILFPFKHAPEMTLQYLRFYREIEIQSKIMEIILPMFEQAKVEEQKSIPTIITLDKAVPPQLKHSPKRVFILISVCSLFFFLMTVFSFWADKAYSRKVFNNPLQLKGHNFVQKLKKFYRIKF